MDEIDSPAICVCCSKKADRTAIKGVLNNPEMCSLLTKATGNIVSPYKLSKPTKILVYEFLGILIFFLFLVVD